ncbi:MAG: oligoribonuclease [Planctomycetota bacterium]
MNDHANLVWIDLEMSGLSVENDTILEIASIVTNSELEILEEGPDLAIHQPEAVLAGMDEWNQRHHGESGLVDRVRESRIDLAEAERLTLEFLRRHAMPGRSPLCGNTVSHDRNFINRYMPTLGAFFHYRNVDVSSVKELVTRWYGAPALPEKKNAHRALEDIRESIEELRHYRTRVFRASLTDGD